MRQRQRPQAKIRGGMRNTSQHKFDRVNRLVNHDVAKAFVMMTTAATGMTTTRHNTVRITGAAVAIRSGAQMLAYSVAILENFRLVRLHVDSHGHVVGDGAFRFALLHENVDRLSEQHHGNARDCDQYENCFDRRLQKNDAYLLMIRGIWNLNSYLTGIPLTQVATIDFGRYVANCFDEAGRAFFKHEHVDESNLNMSIFVVVVVVECKNTVQFLTYQK